VSIGDLDQRIGRDTWCFAPTNSFGTTRISASVLPPSRNVTLILRTQNVTRYEVVNSRPAERGLTLETLERDTGRKFQSYQVQDLSTPANPRGSIVRGRTIQVYRPPAPAPGNRPARPSPDAQPGPAPAVIQRLNVDQRQFDQRMKQERAALNREHQNEIKQQRKKGAPVDQVRQQQQAELQAQQDREAKERRSLDQRRKIVQDRQSKQGQGKGKGNGQGQSAPDQGKSQGKGQGNNSDQGNGGK
jgi:hypothetical protein